MKTRQEYLDGKISHEEYYREIASEAGISFKNSAMLPKIQEALKNGDKHLNTIPLQVWDNLTFGNKARLRSIFEAHDDFYSLAGHVCVIKQSARDAANKED